MLQKIHEKVHGLIAWILIIFIAVTFTLWGVDYYIESHAGNSANLVAEVNGDKINSDVFRIAYQRVKHNEENRLGANFNFTAAFEQQLKQQALKMLILNKVLLQAAQAEGYAISRQQAENALTQYPQFQESGQFSPDKFRQAISSALYTPESFIQQIQDGMLINQQHFAFSGTAFALPSDITDFVRLFNQTRDFSYILVDASKFKDKVVLSETAMQQYYQKNKDNFKTPEQVSIQYIELSIPQLLSQLKLSDQAIKAYYDDNRGNYSKPAQWQLAHILIKLPANATATQLAAASKKASLIEQQLRDGKKFATLAKQYSDDVISAKNGGTMPPMTLGVMGTDFDQALLQLKQPGQFSQPTKTKYGFEIISLIAYKAPQQIPFEQVKEQIAKTINTDKVQQLFSQYSDQLTDITYQNPDSLAQAAKQLNLPIKQSELFGKDGTKQGIASNKKVVQAAYADEVLIQKNNSQPLQINDDTVVVLRLKDHLPAKIIPFAQMQAKISQILSTQQQQQLAKDFGQKLQQALQNNQSVTALLQPINATWKTQTNVKRNAETDSNLISQFAFSLPHPQPGKPQPIAGMAQADGNYVIVKLEKVTDGNIASIKREQRKMFTSEIEAGMGVVDYDLYVQGLMKQAKVVDHLFSNSSH